MSRTLRSIMVGLILWLPAVVSGEDPGNTLDAAFIAVEYAAEGIAKELTAIYDVCAVWSLLGHDRAMLLRDFLQVRILRLSKAIHAAGTRGAVC